MVSWEVCVNLGSERVHYKLVSGQLVSTLSLDGPVERSLDQKCEGNWAWNGQFRMLVCSSALSSCLTTFISSGGLACCEITTGMVYDHRQTGFYTDGVRTVGSVREGKWTLATARSGERARCLKPFDTVQEFKLEKIVSRKIHVGLPVNCPSWQKLRRT